MPARRNVIRMKVGVIGLGQRISAVVSALKAAGADVEVNGYVDPAPVGLDRLKEEAPIFKREERLDGSVWVGLGP